MIARTGGDEFVVLLSGTATEQMSPALERVRTQVGALNLRAQRGYALDFSVGDAAMAADRPLTLEELMQQADAAMYAHKQSRRRMG